MGNCPTRSQIATIQMKEGIYCGEYKTGTGYNHAIDGIASDTKIPCGKGSLELNGHAYISKIDGVFGSDGTISGEEATIHLISGESFTGVVRQTTNGYEAKEKPSSHNASVNDEEIPQPSAGQDKDDWERRGEELAQQQERKRAKQESIDQRIAYEQAKQHLQKNSAKHRREVI